MRILFFGAFPHRSRDNECLMLKMQEMGHQVFFLNQCNSNDVANVLAPRGIQCSKLNGIAYSKWQVFKQVLALRKQVKKHKIDVVFSHLDPSNLVAVFTQYLSRARFVIVRHHVDEMHLAGQEKSLSYRVIYKLAKEIIVVSQRAKDFMVRQEKVKPEKIDVIFLSYDFSLYEKPDTSTVKIIREPLGEKLVLLTACRLLKNKRPDLSIDVLHALRKKGTDAHLMILGYGDMEQELQEKIKAYQLEAYCTMPGFKRNMMDYLQAADILIHPSLLDSSSVIIKEAGLQQKPVIACTGIGDCDEYIHNDVNGYLVKPDEFVAEAVAIIAGKLVSESKRKAVGEALQKVVLQRFDINSNIHHYQRYLQ